MMMTCTMERSKMQISILTVRIYVKPTSIEAFLLQWTRLWGQYYTCSAPSDLRWLFHPGPRDELHFGKSRRPRSREGCWSAGHARKQHVKYERWKWVSVRNAASREQDLHPGLWSGQHNHQGRCPDGVSQAGECSADGGGDSELWWREASGLYQRWWAAEHRRCR